MPSYRTDTRRQNLYGFCQNPGSHSSVEQAVCMRAVLVDFLGGEHGTKSGHRPATFATNSAETAHVVGYPCPDALCLSKKPWWPVLAGATAVGN